MKTLQQLFATMLLVLAIGIPTCAGEMSGPSRKSVPAPAPLIIVPSPPAPAPADPNAPTLTMLVLDFLASALSMY